MSSVLEKERLKYHPLFPNCLRDLLSLDSVEKEQATVHFQQGHSTKTHAPLRVGVLLSGGQAAGGHNVIIGLFDALKKMHSDCRLFGFLGGPSGLIDRRYKELTEQMLAGYRNTGGFDLIGSGRTKIETPEQFEVSRKNVEELCLDGLVIIGGDDSNTNAALLAEYFLLHQCQTRIVGVPKTIDGDLKSAYIEASFGFDSACKTYSELIGNIARDALSAKKYTHFIKLMGRSASHITLECALQTHPNSALIGEEIAAHKMTLQDIASQIADVICARAKAGKNYGVVLIPEGLIEFIPEMQELMDELNNLSFGLSSSDSLSEKGKKILSALPKEIADQLLMDRDPHGNVQVSHIATEQLMIQVVKKELTLRKDYTGKFTPLNHFLGYEGRACFPSNFDANYCYTLGHTAALLIDFGYTGYMSIVQNLAQPVENWKIGGIPLAALMAVEKRRGKYKSVIQKALVDLDGEPFKHFISQRAAWAVEDDYCYPGPIQFFGSDTLCNEITATLKLESSARKAYSTI